MSLPAREAERWATPAPQPVRRRAVTPARSPAARPPIPNPPHPHRRARRGHHSAFWVFTAVVVSAMVVGLVSLNAMRVDAAYRTRSVAERVRLLTDETTDARERRRAAVLAVPDRHMGARGRASCTRRLATW